MATSTRLKRRDNMGELRISQKLADFVKEKLKGALELNYNAYKNAFFIYVSTFDAIDVEKVNDLIRLAGESGLHFEMIRAIEDKLEFVFVKPL